ncbi:MAG: GlyGly-CTERM sorting domain-containing protein [Bacteroidales bacterium]|nr:GlyGly-CTERM sorting domain-containing protein [Bacteroidales bacterium]
MPLQFFSLLLLCLCGFWRRSFRLQSC